MGVFDELKRMSDGEIVKRMDEIEKSLKRGNREKFDEEIREVEEYFEAYLKKGTHTEKDKQEYAEKQKRYEELEKTIKEISLNEEIGELEGLLQEELEKEAQKIRVYVKTKEILTCAEARMNTINAEKNEVISNAKKELAEAKEAAEKMQELDAQIRELEEYFEEYMKKDLHTPKEQEEYAKKQADYDKISEEKKKIPNLSVEEAKNKLNNVILRTPELKTAKKLGRVIDFINDPNNWDKIEKMSEQELKAMIEEKQKESDKQEKSYGGIMPPVEQIHEPEPKKEPDKKTDEGPEKNTEKEPDKKVDEGPEKNTEKEPDKKIDKEPIYLKDVWQDIGREDYIEQEFAEREANSRLGKVSPIQKPSIFSKMINGIKDSKVKEAVTRFAKDIKEKTTKSITKFTNNIKGKVAEIIEKNRKKKILRLQEKIEKSKGKASEEEIPYVEFPKTAREENAEFRREQAEATITFEDIVSDSSMENQAEQTVVHENSSNEAPVVADEGR